MEKQFCQSCGMPMDAAESIGTEADGSQNHDYCGYCYQNGAYTGEMTMQEMIDFCAHMTAKNMPDMDEAGARKMMAEFFPKLKRWANEKTA